MAKVIRDLLKTSRAVLTASLAVNVVMAAVLCVLLSPGVLLSYHSDGSLPSVSADPGLHNLDLGHLWKAVILAVTMGALNATVVGASLMAPLGRVLKRLRK